MLLPARGDADMAILIHEQTQVLVQGITGKVGSFQAQIMKEYGTRIVAGVTPGKGGSEVFGIPVYDLVEEAVAEHRIDAALSFVPARFAKEAALEVLASGIPFLVAMAEGIPEQDTLSMIRYADTRGARILGPDTPGVISPGKCKLGVHPHAMFMEGRVGIMSRSGSLSYEVGRLLTAAGIGQSTVVGIGGGPLWGTSQLDVLRMFESDPETRLVVLLGEVGGRMEHDAAAFIAAEMKKSVVALIVGRQAPRGSQMGHAGAIIEGDEGTVESKAAALERAGAVVAGSSAEIPDIIMRIGV
jgi:succinyl-CoA synthetase alpha subunit